MVGVRLGSAIRATRTDSPHQGAPCPASGWPRKGAQCDRYICGTQKSSKPTFLQCSCDFRAQGCQEQHRLPLIPPGTLRLSRQGDQVVSSFRHVWIQVLRCHHKIHALFWCQHSAPCGSHCPKLTVDKNVFFLITTAKVSELALIGQSGSHAHPSTNHYGQDYVD